MDRPQENKTSHDPQWKVKVKANESGLGVYAWYGELTLLRASFTLFEHARLSSERRVLHSAKGCHGEILSNCIRFLRSCDPVEFTHVLGSFASWVV